MKTIILIACLCALSSCANRTDPAFLQQASGALYGITGGVARTGLMAAPAPRRYSGFENFFGGAR